MRDDDSDGHQRLPAQIEEVVVDPDAFGRPAARPDRGQRLLGVGPRSRRTLERPADAAWSRTRERLTIDFAVCGQRESLHQNEGGRNHVLRQPFFQMTRAASPASECPSSRGAQRPDVRVGSLLSRTGRLPRRTVESRRRSRVRVRFSSASCSTSTSKPCVVSRLMIG